MSKQPLLFRPPQRPLVQRLQQQLPAKNRQEIISILAEMCRKTLGPVVKKPRQEARDES